MTDLMILQNDGPSIAYTNYFDTEQAERGLLYLSWNAGQARLLVPDSQQAYLAEMLTGREVVISTGPLPDMGLKEAVEIMFDDASEAPFAVHLVLERMDRVLDDKSEGASFMLTVMTRQGVFVTLPARYRTVPRLPCLAAWGGKV